MIKSGSLPDKIFGIDSRLLIIWLKPFLLVLVIIVSFALLLLPKFSESQSNLVEINSVNKKIKEINQKVDYLASLDQDELASNAERLSIALLPEKNAYLLVKVLKNVTMNTGYSISDFSISLGEIKVESAEKKKSSNYDQVLVEVTLVGPMDKYLDLVTSIEKSLPLMSIEKLKMNSTNGSSVVDLNVAAYYLKELSNLKIESLSLSDLTPSKQESELISTIMDFEIVGVENSQESEFVKYERGNPFSIL